MPPREAEETAPPDPDPDSDGGPSQVELAVTLGRVLRDMGSKALGRLRPRTVLYLHLSDQALRASPATSTPATATSDDPGSRGAAASDGRMGACDSEARGHPGGPEGGSAGNSGGGHGRRAVARAEGHGPLSLPELRDWLGTDHVVVRPVLDIPGQEPVDGYEVPRPLAEAVRLADPYEVTPYGTLSSRGADLDHTRPYRPPNKGGPPGQTALGNLGPLSRRAHRAKTFGGFTLHQPLPGLYLWCTPTGHWYRVDHTGTTRLGTATPDIVEHLTRRGSPMEAGLVDSIWTALTCELAA